MVVDFSVAQVQSTMPSFDTKKSLSWLQLPWRRRQSKLVTHHNLVPVGTPIAAIVNAPKKTELTRVFGEGYHKGEFIFSGLLALLGIVIMIASMNYGLLREGGRTGPGLVPFVAGLVLLPLSVQIAVQAIRTRRIRVKDSQSQQGAFTRALVILGLAALGTVFAPIIGHFVAFGIVIVLMLIIVEKKRIIVALTFAALAASAGWLIFEQLLTIPMPG